MKNDTTLILTGEGYGLSIAPEAEKQKAELIKAAAAITVVTTNEQADTAREEVKRLAAMRILVEKSRKAVNEPVLKITREINAKAAEFAEEIHTQEKRLGLLIGDHAMAVETERQKKLAEERRLAEEAEKARRAEEKARADAEAARLKAEREAAAALTDDDDIAAAAAYDAQVAADKEADRLASERACAEAESSRQSMTTVKKTAGVKFEPEFEVEDIDALYRHNVSLVELTPRRARILEAIKMGMRGDTPPTIPGLKITMKATVSTR